MNELPRSSPEFFLCPQICCNSTTQSKLANPNSEQIFFSGSESQIPVKVLVRNEDERIPFFFFFLVNSSEKYGPLEAQKETTI